MRFAAIELAQQGGRNPGEPPARLAKEEQIKVRRERIVYTPKREQHALRIKLGPLAVGEILAAPYYENSRRLDPSSPSPLLPHLYRRRLYSIVHKEWHRRSEPWVREGLIPAMPVGRRSHRDRGHARKTANA
jgi:hypothetical protein